jgi:uncharacterized membrane protein YqhA
MTANLLLIVVFSGFENFLHKLEAALHLLLSVLLATSHAATARGEGFVNHNRR